MRRANDVEKEHRVQHNPKNRQKRYFGALKGMGKFTKGDELTTHE